MREQKGITLIALVITIIVLLILAGVTIAMLAGENGILGRSTQTKEANAEAQAREQSNLAYMTVRTEIAALKVKDGTYKPASSTVKDGSNDKPSNQYLAELCAKDLNTTAQSAITSTAGWNVAYGEGSITLKFIDSALNNTNHSLTYTITLPNDTTTPATITGPTETYKQINS